MFKTSRKTLPMIVLFVLCCAVSVQAEPYAVRFTLEGFVGYQDDKYLLNTDDGRVFVLKGDEGELRRVIDKHVRVEGKAHRADDCELIKVQKLTTCPAPTGPEIPVAHADYQRPVKILKKTADAYVIKDVRWGIEQDPATTTLKAKHTFVTATIRPELLDDAFFTLKPFPPRCVAGHSMIVFTFKKGGMVAADGTESQAMAVTIEAYKKLGQTYGIIKTLKKSFEVVWSLVTWENYAHLNVKFNTDTDKQLLVYPFLLTRAQKIALLRETIEQSGVNRKGEFYHTLRNNCTNNLAILLNRVLPEDKQIKLWTIPSVLYNVKATMPVLLVKNLIKRKIIGEKIGEVTTTKFSTEMPPK